MEQVEKTLMWARANTLLLQVNDTWIQIALRVTDTDGPGKGDRSLLGVLVRQEVVIKGASFDPIQYSSGSHNKNKRK